MDVLKIIIIVLFFASTIGFVVSLAKNIIKKDYNCNPILWCIAINFLNMVFKIVNSIR